MLEMMKAMKLEIENMKKVPVFSGMVQNDNDEPVEIGCKLFNGATLSSANGDVSVVLKCGEETEVTIRELKDIFRNQFDFKNMFRKGVLYFVDKDMYKYFKIRNVIDLSDEKLIEELVEKEPNEMVKFLKKVTNDKRNDMVSHTICYNVASMLRDGKLKFWSYDGQSTFEQYMNVKLSNVIKNIDKIKKITH